MPKYKLTIEYKGTDFVGWQVQENGPSIQGQVIEAFKKFCGEDVQVKGAGRTDAGVHALGQVAHAELTKPQRTDKIRDALNHHLKPDPISILFVEEVVEGFDARFSALKRHYRYEVLNRRSPPAIGRELCWWKPVALDHEKMHEAAQDLVGKHDFTTFRAVGCQANSPVRTLDKINVSRIGDNIYVEASAQSFLHKQIRSFVGSLVQVGSGAWQIGDIKKALEAKERSRCGPVAPPDGLYFVGVDY